MTKKDDKKDRDITAAGKVELEEAALDSVVGGVLQPKKMKGTAYFKGVDGVDSVDKDAEQPANQVMGKGPLP